CRFNPLPLCTMTERRAVGGEAGSRAGANTAAARWLAGALALLLLTGCASVSVNEQRLVSKPNMLFSKSAVYSYSSRILPQLRPRLSRSGEEQGSTCPLCR